MTVSNRNFRDKIKKKTRLLTMVRSKFYRQQSDTEQVANALESDRDVESVKVGKDKSTDIRVEFRGDIFSLNLKG